MLIERARRARWLGSIARLRADRAGGTAMVFALATPVMVGAMALAVDVSMNRLISNRMQITVDGAALAGAFEIERGGDVTAAAVNHVEANLPADYKDMTMDADVTLGIYDGNQFVPDNGPDANAVRVRGERSVTRGNEVKQGLSQIFGVPFQNLQVEAIAARPVNVFYQPPESETLDPEAGDFNEIYAYCFDTLGSGTAASRRTQMTLVANNMPAGQNIVTISGGRISANPANPLPWPRCTQKGQTLSFRLRNIRHVKSNPVLWNNQNATISGVRPGRPEFNYFTDTVLNNGVETINLQGFNILETVLCNTASQCTPGTIGSMIPSGRNRANTRRRETQPCQPGRFMYFGFEDRPPGQSGANSNWLQPAWTDADYDDIRIVMRCPASGRLGDAFVRLVR